jgi:hypothetical protein
MGRAGKLGLLAACPSAGERRTWAGRSAGARAGPHGAGLGWAATRVGPRGGAGAVGRAGGKKERGRGARVGWPKWAREGGWAEFCFSFSFLFPFFFLFISV